MVPACAYVKFRATKRNLTLEALYRVLTWSFMWLLRGVWPDEAPPGCTLRGPSGALLANGLRCAFAGMKGDAKFLKETMLWNCYWRARDICHLCRASRADAVHNYLHVLPDAAEEYLARTPIARQPVFLAMPGLRIEIIYSDLLHTVCLGIGQDFCGSCMVELARGGAFGREFPASDLSPMDAALQEGLLMFERWCLAEGLERPTLDHLSSQSLGLPSYPALPGKAADCRKMLAWLPYITGAYAMGPGPYEETMALCAWAMGQFWFVISNADMFMTAQQRASAMSHGEEYLVSYVVLATEKLRAGERLWKVRPKMHSFHHQCLQMATSRLNPRHMACWADEDYVGRIMAASKAASQRQVAMGTLVRYLATCATQWAPVP